MVNVMCISHHTHTHHTHTHQTALRKLREDPLSLFGLWVGKNDAPAVQTRAARDDLTWTGRPSLGTRGSSSGTSDRPRASGQSKGLSGEAALTSDIAGESWVSSYSKVTESLRGAEARGMCQRSR